MAISAKVSGEPVVAIVNTGSAGVVISDICFERLGLVGDEEEEDIISSAMDTNKKLRRVLIGVKLIVEKKVNIPALVLEGLDFDVLLGMSWIKNTNAVVHAAEGVVSLNGEKLSLSHIQS